MLSILHEATHTKVTLLSTTQSVSSSGPALPAVQRRHLTLVPICLSLPPTSPGSVEMICRTMRILLTQPLTHLQQPSSLPLPWNGNYFKAISLTQGSLLPGTDSCGLFLQDFCPLPSFRALAHSMRTLVSTPSTGLAAFTPHSFVYLCRG